MPTEEELWKPINGFPDYYVSNFGRFKSIKFNRNREKILKPFESTDGYLSVDLQYNKARKTLKVSRCVLEYFHGPPPTEEYQAAHLNGIKSDNHISNLQWKTSKENDMDKDIHMTRPLGQKTNVAKLTPEAVEYIRQNYKRESRTKSNARELAKLFGIARQSVNWVASRRGWKHV